MGESPDKSVGDGEKAESDAIKAAKAAASESAGTDSETAQTSATDRNLPVVWSPQLDAADAPPSIEAEDEPQGYDAAEEIWPAGAETGNEAPSEPVGDAAASAPHARSSRFMLLAASVAIAAALGSFLGSLGASGIGRLLPASPANSSTADARDVLQAMKVQLAELAAIKSNLDGATRSASSQSAKIAHIADTVDKLDKHNFAAAETTGSIAAAQPPATEPKLPVLDGWIVQDVQNGRAMVATRYGGVFEVGAGSFLPGLGRVETIKREDGKWIVVTARGVISSAH